MRRFQSGVPDRGRLATIEDVWYESELRKFNPWIQPRSDVHDVLDTMISVNNELAVTNAQAAMLRELGDVD
jgi:hypothetical protein